MCSKIVEILFSQGSGVGKRDVEKKFSKGS